MASGASKPTLRLVPSPTSLDFTPAAAQRWEAIAPQMRERLLSNVWCAHCHHEVTMVSFSGRVREGALLLVGQCAECRGDVARRIEGDAEC